MAYEREFKVRLDSLQSLPVVQILIEERDLAYAWLQEPSLQSLVLPGVEHVVLQRFLRDETLVEKEEPLEVSAPHLQEGSARLSSIITWTLLLKMCNIIIKLV